MVLSKGGQYTKHIYIGSQRIVSKLGDIGSFGVDPRREEYAGEDIAGVKVPDYKNKYISLQEVITNTYTLFEVPYLAVDNNNYVDGEGFCCNDDNSSRLKSIPTGNADYEKLQYYYHPDHLGSASYITNLDGEVVQHIEYVPFGEVFIEERNNTWNTPFLFNGKELDEETGLYYVHDRYYNPRISIWYGVDKMTEKYPSWSPYHYCHNNPVNMTDPDGMEADWVQKEDKTIYWDDNAVDQSTTKEGEKYLGKQGYSPKYLYRDNGTIGPNPGITLNSVDVRPNEGDVMARAVNNAINENATTVAGVSVGLSVAIIGGVELAIYAGATATTKMAGTKMAISAGSQYLANDGKVDLIDVLSDGFLAPGAGSLIGGGLDLSFDVNNPSVPEFTGLGFGKDPTKAMIDIGVGYGAGKMANSVDGQLRSVVKNNTSVFKFGSTLTRTQISGVSTGINNTLKDR